jgi:hypothetical protein
MSCRDQYTIITLDVKARHQGNPSKNIRASLHEVAGDKTPLLRK